MTSNSRSPFDYCSYVRPINDCIPEASNQSHLSDRPDHIGSVGISYRLSDSFNLINPIFQKIFQKHILFDLIIC